MADTDDTADTKTTTLQTDVSTSIGVFIVTTVIYCILKIIFASPTDKFWLLGYLLITVIVQFQLNSMIAKDNCNDNDQIVTAFIATMLPWIGMFFTINILLLMFPGWKSPFSNTLGYFIAFLSGIKPAFLKLLKKPESIDASNIEDKALLESINHIYNDVSTMINELNTQNFEEAMVRMQPLLNAEAQNDPSLKKELFKYIVMKETIGELVWLILTGCMVVNVAFTYIVNSECVA
jgi:hypothetical protein|tara:strand:+ start:12312 stop:13016 length:705 start_codon:yes stop_codon:yes gene_type:complete